MSRVVIVASPSANQAKRVTTDATTWGQLKNNAEVAALLVGEVDAIVKPGNVTLRGDDSVLPEGNFNLYLIATRNKAGVISVAAAKELGKEIAEAIVSAANKASDTDVRELKEELIEVIENHFDVDLNEETDSELKSALEEAKNL